MTVIPPSLISSHNNDNNNGNDTVVIRAHIKQHDVDKIEIVYLTVIILIGIPLNVNAFVRLIRQPKMPTATTSFLTGPYYTSSFVLFKMNLSVTDFAILLIHALGKVIWLLTYDWKFGDIGCRSYQFLSAFTYYSNSNVVVAIGIDRLIVVYTSHIQGATSKRRVRLLLFFTWLTAALCALPQIFVWTSVEVSQSFYQCTTVWQVSAHQNSATYQNSRKQILYEIFHQSIVFWLPFFTLLASYVFIIFKVLRYTLVFVGSQELNSFSSVHSERTISPLPKFHQTASAKLRALSTHAKSKNKARKSVSYQLCLMEEKSSNKFLLGAPSTETLNSANSKGYVISSANSYATANANENGGGLLLKRVESDLSGYYTNLGTMTTTSSDNAIGEHLKINFNTTTMRYSNKNNNNTLANNNGSSERKCSITATDNNSLSETLIAQESRVKTTTLVYRAGKIGDAKSTNISNMLIELERFINILKRKVTNNASSRRNSMVILPETTLDDQYRSNGLLHPPFSQPPRNGAQRQQQQKFVSCSQVWKRQLRSRVFITSLAIVIIHCALWLPYNLLNSMRFMDGDLYEWMVGNGGFLLEDLIVLNSVVNPILYGYESKWVICKSTR